MSWSGLCGEEKFHPLIGTINKAGNYFVRDCGFGNYIRNIRTVNASKEWQLLHMQ
jgi:hypothetical protein